jgi:hypothetical protein
MSDARTAGLCDRCRHVRRLHSRRGSTFFLCGRSADDERYARYPRVPVVRCPGFESGSAPPPDAASDA